MVTVLRLIPPRGNRRWHRRRLFGEWRRFGGTRYLILSAETDRNGEADWTAIRQALAHGDLRLVPARSVVLPPDGPTAFADGALKRELMRHTAEYLIGALSGAFGGRSDNGILSPRPSGRRLMVGVYDPSGEWAEHLSDLTDFHAYLRVVTDAPDAYAAAAQTGMDRAGAALPVGDNRAALNRCALIVAPDGVDGLAIPPRTLVLSGVSGEAHPQVADGYLPAAVRERLGEIPNDCDAAAFLSAVYEEDGDASLAEGIPLAVTVGGGTVSMRDILWRVAGLDIGISV